MSRDPRQRPDVAPGLESVAFAQIREALEKEDQAHEKEKRELIRAHPQDESASPEQTQNFYLVHAELESFLTRHSIDARVLPLGVNKYFICGPGITRPIAANFMDNPSVKAELHRARIVAVEFHKSCVVNADNYDADHFIGEFVVTP